MVLNLFDKLVFGLALLLALQVPLLVEDYQQFLAGQHDVLQAQVEGYQANAAKHGYADVGAMIAHHQQNAVASVREDAKQKQSTLLEYETVKAGMKLFAEGNLLQKVWYIVQPERLERFVKTLDHYRPGIPLATESLVFAVVLALIINWLVWLPIWLIGRMFKPKARRAFG